MHAGDVAAHVAADAEDGRYRWLDSGNRRRFTPNRPTVARTRRQLMANRRRLAEY